VFKPIPILSVALGALALTACGSDSSPTGSTSAGGPTPSSPAAGGGTETTPDPGSRAPGSQHGAEKDQAGSGSSPADAESGAAGGSSGARGRYEYEPDDSLQTFGDEVHGRAKAEVSRAVLALFRSLAKPDYPRICARIAERNREQILQYAELRRLPQKSCPELLATLMSPPNRLIRRASGSEITHVRVNGDESIVFFRPPGGKVSYIPMVREEGRWKSVTLVPGTPVNPVLGER
jgi:hypothetical protein